MYSLIDLRLYQSWVTLLEQVFKILHNPVYQLHRSPLFKNLYMVVQIEQNLVKQCAIFNNVV